MKIIVFINGAAGSGKDTIVEHAMSTKIDGATLSVLNVSSIDCVRRLLHIDVSDKRDETRKCLADVGAALEEYNQFRSKGTAIEIIERAVQTPHYDAIVFVHVREKYMIERITQHVNTYIQKLPHKWPVAFVSLLVKRRGVILVDNNSSDIEAHQADPKDYDHCYENSGTLLELRAFAKNFMQSLNDVVLAAEKKVPDVADRA